MRIFILIFTLTTFGNIFSKYNCPVFLEKYDDECEIYEKFNRYKKTFEAQNINIDNISYYRMSRLIHEKDLKPDPITGQYYPWNIYSGKNKHHVWQQWEIGDEARKEIYKKIQFQQNTFNLSLEDISQLHKTAISQEIRGIKGMLPTFLVPDSGELRSKNNLRSGFFLNRPIDSYEEAAIKELDGVEYTPSTKYISYVKSENVPMKLRAWNQKLNELVNDIKNNRLHPSLTPFKVIADLQREFVAIHPFHEGVGRTGRFIQDIICDYLGLPYIPGGLLQNDVLTQSKDYVNATKSELYKMMNIFEKCSIPNNFPECIELYKNTNNIAQINYQEEENKIRRKQCPYFLANFKNECAIYAQYLSLTNYAQEERGMFTSVDPTLTYAFNQQRGPISSEWYKGETTRQEIVSSLKAGGINKISTSDVLKMIGFKNFKDINSQVSAKELDNLNYIVNEVNKQLKNYRNQSRTNDLSPFEYLPQIESIVNKSVFSNEKKTMVQKYLKDTFLELLDLPPELTSERGKSVVDRYKETFNSIKKCYSEFVSDNFCDPMSSVIKIKNYQEMCLKNNTNNLNSLKDIPNIIDKIEKKCYIKLDIPYSVQKPKEIEFFIENKKIILKQEPLHQNDTLNNVYSVESNDICNHEYNLNSQLFITYYDENKKAPKKPLGCLMLTERNPPCKKWLPNEKENEDYLKEKLNGESVNISLKFSDDLSPCYDNSKSFSYSWNSEKQVCEEYILKKDGTKYITKTFPQNISCEDSLIIFEWTKEGKPLYKYDEDCKKVVDKDGMAIIRQGLNSFYTKTAFEAKLGGIHFPSLGNAYRFNQTLYRIENTQSDIQTPEEIYRGIKRVNSYKKGDFVVDSGFASATPIFETAAFFANNTLRSEENSGGTILIFDNKQKNLKGVNINQFSRFTSEEEYLFHPNDLKGYVTKTIFIPKKDTPNIDKEAILKTVKDCLKEREDLNLDYNDLENRTLIFLCPTKKDCFTCN